MTEETKKKTKKTAIFFDDEITDAIVNSIEDHAKQLVNYAAKEAVKKWLGGFGELSIAAVKTAIGDKTREQFAELQKAIDALLDTNRVPPRVMRTQPAPTRPSAPFERPTPFVGIGILKTPEAQPAEKKKGAK